MSDEILRLMIFCLHEKAGHYIRRINRDKGLIFINSFEFYESGFYFEKKLFENINILKMVNVEFAKKFITKFFLSFLFKKKDQIDPYEKTSINKVLLSIIPNKK